MLKHVNGKIQINQSYKLCLPVKCFSSDSVLPVIINIAQLAVLMVFWIFRMNLDRKEVVVSDGCVYVGPEGSGVSDGVTITQP